MKKVIQLQESWRSYILLLPSFLSLSSYCSCSYQVPISMRLVFMFLVSLHYSIFLFLFFLHYRARLGRSVNNTFKTTITTITSKETRFHFLWALYTMACKMMRAFAMMRLMTSWYKKRHTSYSEEFVKCKSWSQNSCLHRSEHLRGCFFSKCQHF